MELVGKIVNNKIEVKINGKETELNNIFVFIKGKIFNRECIAKKYNIQYKEDNELIANLYRKLNLNFLNELDGIYAIIIHDKSKKETHIIKDKLGNINLFYYYYDNSFIFSTSLKDLSNDKLFKKEIDKNSLANYLGYTYIYEPYTIYKNTFKVKKGSIITYKNNKIEENVYFDLIKEYKNTKKEKGKSDEELANDLEKLFLKSLKKLANKESTVGIFLSGGKDSGLLAKLSKGYYKKVNTYTLGFEGENDEIERAYKIAKYIDTNHYSYKLSDKEIPRLMKKISKIYQEPFADPSIINCIYLLENINNENNCLLTGDSCDAIFMQSSMYNIYNIAQRIRIIKEKIIYIITKRRAYHNFSEMAQKNIISRFTYSDKLTGIKGQVKDVQRVECKRRSIALFDLMNTVVEKYKVKISSATSYYNIESYTPYYDIDILKYMFTLPMNKLYRKKQGKYIFNKVVYKNIPFEYYENYNKKGFGIPIVKWSETIIKEAEKLSEKDFIDKQNLFKHEELSKLFNYQRKSPSYDKIVVIWCYYCFQNWYLENVGK